MKKVFIETNKKFAIKIKIYIENTIFLNKSYFLKNVEKH